MGNYNVFLIKKLHRATSVLYINEILGNCGGLRNGLMFVHSDKFLLLVKGMKVEAVFQSLSEDQ